MDGSGLVDGKTVRPEGPRDVCLKRNVSLGSVRRGVPVRVGDPGRTFEKRESLKPTDDYNPTLSGYSYYLRLCRSPGESPQLT